MVNVTYVRENNKIINLTIKGHANSNVIGKDLVCAGVSAIVVGGINALSDNEQNFDIIIKEGFVEIKAIKDVNEHDQIVLETILTQLSSLQETHEKFIQVKGKE